MELKIKNIRRSFINYRDPKNPDYQRVIGYIEYLAKSQKKTIDPGMYLPHFVKNSIIFELHDTIPMFANMIRVYLLSGCLVKCMTFENRETDDLALIADAIRVNINAIPIKQDYDYKGVNAIINVKNLGKDVANSGSMDVMSSHIEFTRDGKKIPNSEICNETYLIATLPEGKFLKIELKLEDGYGFDAENRFQAISKFSYRELNKVKPTLQALPTAYEIGFQTYTDDKPELFIKKMETKILEDLKKIETELAEVKKSKNPDYVSDHMIISSKMKYKHIELVKIPGQLANCIARYMFDQNPEIGYIIGGKVRLSSSNAQIKLSNPENTNAYILEIELAIKKIKQDLSIFVKSLV